jgi:hypothetical protein
MPGTTAAELGAPSTSKFNGLGIVPDTLHHLPKHALAATWATLPGSLTGKPSISDIAVLNRRDALIVYVPAVKGAADYRAYILDNNVTITANAQPRDAVIACAGYRQRYRRNINMLLPGGNYETPSTDRELIQAIEVPGLVKDGNYTVIVEAIASPCPFPGVTAHTTASIPRWPNLESFTVRGFDDVRSLYGNEILNGQGSALSDYKKSTDGILPDEPLGQPVPPNSTTIPADPVVIARSALQVTRPAADEALNGPIFDLGENAVFDDFATDGIMTSLTQGQRGLGYGFGVSGKFNDWFFWTMRVQPAFKPNSTEIEDPTNPKAVQVWQRHGRLYTEFGDMAQDVMGGVYFASTKTLPLQLDTSQYVHSMFRVDSGATGRRYWHWLMCGAETRDELVDPATHIPRIQPVGTAFFQEPQGINPSSDIDGEPLTSYHKKECLNLIQVGGEWIFGPPPNTQPGWFDEPHSKLHAFINPEGSSQGVINLKTTGIDDYDTNATGGMAWRINSKKQPTGTMFEPFDQQAPLTHYDVFVRQDRVIFYINGRQAWCADLSDRPLTMKYGLIAYGSVLYHSGAENMEAYLNGKGGTYHYVMNTPWSDTRVWDAVSHSEKIGIPTQFAFDPAACFKPANTQVP